MIYTKKGLSNVVATLMLILLTLVIVGVVWGVVEVFIDDTLTEECFDVYEKFTINEEYTCYDVTSQELLFSLNVGDVELSGALLSFTSQGESKSVELSSTSERAIFVRSQGGNYGEFISLPKRGEGKAYAYDAGNAPLGRIDFLEIAPRVGETLCEVTDSMVEIPRCL